MTTALWWIRRDLRLSDNQALHRAMELADDVLPIFILDRRLLDSSHVGVRRTSFLMKGLHSLDSDLQERGSRLIVREGEPSMVLGQLCTEHNISSIVAEKDVSPFARQRDRLVTKAVEGAAVEFTGGLTIRPIGAVRKADGQPYTVFTPYSRRWKAAGPVTYADLLPAPTLLNTPTAIESMPIPNEPCQEHGRLWTAGEAAARARLHAFVGSDSPPIYDYAGHRDRPDLDATSGLSPYLRFGMLSPRAAAAEAYAAMHLASTDAARRSAETWLNELIWREFYINVLADFPHIRSDNFRPQYDAIRWDNGREAFDAWRYGQTGYPIVDAAMRQLLATGWMHNRTRMIVASFLVKDLLIDWRWGERWFMQQLLDGDPATNNGGWQWTAGTGTDAAPYFRIFNPTSQGKKFDPDGAYVRKWIPELEKVRPSVIHEPWKMSASEQAAAGCRLGTDYPRPIVDHGWARQRTLDAYSAARAEA